MAQINRVDRRQPVIHRVTLLARCFLRSLIHDQHFSDFDAIVLHSFKPHDVTEMNRLFAVLFGRLLTGLAISSFLLFLALLLLSPLSASDVVAPRRNPILRILGPRERIFSPTHCAYAHELAGFVIFPGLPTSVR